MKCVYTGLDVTIGNREIVGDLFYDRTTRQFHLKGIPYLDRPVWPGMPPAVLDGYDSFSVVADPQYMELYGVRLSFSEDTAARLEKWEGLEV